jgi:hypothetical protein
LIKKLKIHLNQYFQNEEVKWSFDYLIENLYLVNKDRITSDVSYIKKAKKDKFRILRDSLFNYEENSETVKKKYKRNLYLKS